MIKPNRPADQMRRIAPAPILNDLVPFAHMLRRQIKQRRRLPPRRTPQVMPLTMRHQRERTRPKLHRLLARHPQPARTRRHDVKQHAVRHRRQRDPPGRRQHRSRVHHTFQTQEVQRLSQRIRRSPRPRYPRLSRRVSHLCHVQIIPIIASRSSKLDDRSIHSDIKSLIIQRNHA